jgi:hypothetical protein
MHQHETYTRVTALPYLMHQFIGNVAAVYSCTANLYNVGFF